MKTTSLFPLLFLLLAGSCAPTCPSCRPDSDPRCSHGVEHACSFCHRDSPSHSGSGFVDNVPAASPALESLCDL